MNKLAIFTIPAALAVTAIAVPLASQEIVVSPRSDTTFVTEVSRDLDEQLNRIRLAPHWDASGISKVRFQAGPDGKAVHVKTYEGSGNGALDRVARKAVSRLTSLNPMPYGSEQGQVIQANIIVASTHSQLERLSRRLAREEAARIARSPDERKVLALTLAPRPVS